MRGKERKRKKEEEIMCISAFFFSLNKNVTVRD